MWCEGNPCKHCGGRTWKGYRSLCQKQRKDRGLKPTSSYQGACVFLGDPTGDETPVRKHCGCGSEVMLTSVFDCLIHSECTPLGRSELHSCPCPDYSATE